MVRQQDEDTLGKLAESTLDGIRFLRKKSVRRAFPQVSEFFEDSLEDLGARPNPYKPGGGNNYKDEDFSEDEDQEEDMRAPKQRVQDRNFERAIVGELLNPMRARMGMAPVQLKKRVESSN